MVAEDLLELDAAIAVDAVGPADEPLVEVGAGPLEDPVVGGVADHDVLEAVRALVAVLDGGWTRCLWARVESSVRTRGETSGGVSAVTAASGKT